MPFKAFHRNLYTIWLSINLKILLFISYHLTRCLNTLEEREKFPFPNFAVNLEAVFFSSLIKFRKTAKKKKFHLIEICLRIILFFQPWWFFLDCNYLINQSTCSISYYFLCFVVTKAATVNQIYTCDDPNHTRKREREKERNANDFNFNPTVSGQIELD